MMLKSIEANDVNLETFILVGDKLSDLESGLVAGLKNLYLIESCPTGPENRDVRTSTFSDLFRVATYLQTHSS
jgi:histidinol phosphatase-like enzyme